MSNKQLTTIIKRLREMRLSVMAEELLTMSENNELLTKSALEVLDILSSEQWISRKNNTIFRLKKRAKLSQQSAQLEDIDYDPQRQLNRQLIDQLRTNDYIRKHRNIIILGACGTGKSYIANALGNHACENGYSTYYSRIFEFLDDCQQEYLLNQSVRKTIDKYAKFEVLIIDDFLVGSISEKEANYIFQLFEYRYGKKSTIVCSQLEPKEWHTNLGGGILADSTLDRIIPSSYELVLSGESNR